MRVALTKLAIFLALALPWLPAVHAHMLNMTEIQISAEAKTDATVTVQIDLGQSGLMTPVSYWDAVRKVLRLPYPKSLVKVGAPPQSMFIAPKSIAPAPVDKQKEKAMIFPEQEKEERRT